MPTHNRSLTGFLTTLLLSCLCLLAPMAAHTEQGAKANDDLFSVTFPTEKEGWACGRYGTILHTSDGGATWSPQASGTTFTAIPMPMKSQASKLPIHMIPTMKNASRGLVVRLVA